MTPVERTQEQQEPMLVSRMRRYPMGQVKHIPGAGIGSGGTSTRGFLVELDRHIATLVAAAKAEQADADAQLALDTMKRGYPLVDGDTAFEIVRTLNDNAAAVLRGEASPAPCKCHNNYAAVTPTHPGHCCFNPADQTCHPEEVALWQRRLRGEATKWESACICAETPFTAPQHCPIHDPEATK